jgi:hypothetical protein
MKYEAQFSHLLNPETQHKMPLCVQYITVHISVFWPIWRHLCNSEVREKPLIAFSVIHTTVEILILVLCVAYSEDEVNIIIRNISTYILDYMVS